MQERSTYTEIEDFLSDKSFQSWILSQIDEDGWEEWTLENQQRAKLVEDARLFLLAMKAPNSELSNSDIHKALQDTWSKIEKKENQIDSTQNNTFSFLKKYFLAGVAAALFFCLMSVWFYKSTSSTSHEVVTYNELIDDNKEGLVEQTNNSSKPQIITLSDGSSVLLQPNSKLSYPKIFTGNERKVYLSGEGFFEISKNPKKPFFVYANEIVTKVVGTSFRVKAYSDQPNVEVLVRTGKVKVKSNELVSMSDREVVLLPNQALRFQRSDLTFNKITNITQDKTLVSSVGNIEQLSFEFTDIPVAQIFETIEQAYLIDIDYPKDKLKECHLTTSLSDQPLTEKLRIVCKSIGNNTSFEMNGNQIIILSEGCN
ncbi:MULTISPECIES: FecR family protein [Flavobacterium]|jgi:transmembrane sensor|uniref:FecR family protein n=1 Tax=Flavobacterium cupriresistens TaxID=2893885 RepID=A0ABU4RA94_9FLAO|nr:MULTISPECIES: FecR family protein [unclassified Flavobacterium]KLT70390.1 iron dicitrate transport regulator FecR [Flavobacterium sp. ABG]MDX6189161.1 FecR family protein [Flavobacterium sp. Fl-318]UFH41258.1 FecR family protein [Flavobacterium sp. F-323]